MPDGTSNQKHNRRKILMIGPLPPPSGGVATFVLNMRGILTSHIGYYVEVFRIGGSATGVSKISQLVADISRVFIFIKRYGQSDHHVVHIHNSSYYSFFRVVPYIFWNRYFSNAKVIIHIHGGMFVEYYKGANSLIRYLVKWSLGSADRVIVTSPSWIEKIGQIVRHSHNIISLPNGFDSNTFRPLDKAEARRELGIPIDCRAILNIGYLEEVKGHQYLIESMVEVKERDSSVILYIIGNGSLKERLTQKVKELGLENHIIFIDGGLPSKNIALWINATDLCVLPSLAEGNPTVMFESLACGRPFIGTRVGGIPDVISRGDVGIVCEPGDVKGLANAIIAAFHMSWDEQKISTYANQYSWTSISSKLINIYDEVLTK